MKSATMRVTLPDICEVVTDGTHDSPRLLPSGIPFIKGKHISSGRIDFEDCDYISEEDHAKCVRRVKPQSGDVLFSNIGSVGDAARVTDDIEFSIKNLALFRPDRAKVDPLYFYYLVVSPFFRGHFLNVRSGSAQPFISLENFRSLKFPCLTNRTLQERIGRILSAYDDLIENNRRRIQLLEQAARLLYKEWFVHLRFPGHEHVKIKNGVPEGWEKGIVADFFDTTSGGTPSRENPDFFAGDINWVKTQELNEDFIFETEEKITEEAVKKSSTKLFPENTLLVSIYGGTNIGRTGILAVPATSNQACVALFPRHPSANHIFAQLFFQSIRDSLIGVAQGAAQTNISQQTLRKVTMVISPEATMRHFLEFAEPIYEQLKNLKKQNMGIAKARDLLVPRLMHGEVSV